MIFTRCRGIVGAFAAAGFALLCLVATAAETTAPAASCFTRSYDQRKHYISPSPAQRWGLFRLSDHISIRVATHSPVRVFTLRGQTVYEGAPGKLPQLPVGHYFVETDGDRSQFAVLPDDYAGASFLGMASDAGNNSSITAKLKLIEPAWVRVSNEGLWEVVQPLSGMWEWDELDRVVQVNPGRRIIVNAFHRPAWVNDERFIPLFTEYIKRMARRYRGKIYAIEIWNEPYHVTDDPPAPPACLDDT